MRMADRLARLAHRLAGHGAAVDDDPIVVRRRGPGDGLAFGEIEAAAEADGLDAHCSVSRSSSPSNTCVAPPRMRIGSPGAPQMGHRAPAPAPAPAGSRPPA